MKIGGYAHFNQNRDLTPGLDKREPESSRTCLPLSLKGFEDHPGNLISSDRKRVHVQAYFDNIKKFREQLYHLEKEGMVLDKARNKITQLHEMLANEGNEPPTRALEFTEIRDELSTCYQAAEMIRPELSAALSELEPLLAPGDGKTWSKHEPALTRALEHLDAAKESLSQKQEILQEKITGAMVAMENLMASQSLIRDEERASRVIDQLKVSIAKNVDQSMLSQANLNRNYILGLIR